jgi:polysaccharide export outer membrane protein
LSVGEAIAVSGGYQMAFLRTAIPTNPFDLKSELEQLQVERFKEQIRINRLNAELSGTAGISLTSIKAPEIGPDFARAIAALEIEQAQGRLVEYNNEVDHLKRTLAQGEKYTAILKEQLTKQSTGSEADTAELNRIRELFERGTVPMLRYSDVRRAQLLGEERFLQTRAQMEQVARDQLDVGRQLARLQERRKLEIAQALQDAKLKLEIANKKIVNLESKFQTWRSGRVRTAPMADNPAEISITRGPAGKKETVRASEDTGLLAGDLVRVRLREATEWRGQ